MQNEYTITFTFDNRVPVTAKAAAGTSILDIAQSSGIAIDAPCAGNGTCGKCAVRLVTGELESEQNRHISADDYENGKRLACVSLVSGDAEIYVPPSADAYRNRIRVDNNPTKDVPKDIKPNAGFTCVQVSLSKPTLDDPMADRERLIDAISAAPEVAGKSILISPAVLKELPHIMRESSFNFFTLVSTDKKSDSALVYEISKDRITPLGVCVDIGTTSVSALLVNLVTGEILANANMGNPQIRYGADVIHRIVASEKQGGLAVLHNAIIDECLKPLIAELCTAAVTEPTRIVRASFAGNTTMIHFLAGISADYLRREPYVPAFFELSGLRGSDLAIGIHSDAQVSIAPAVGSYVGGDITAGAFASGIASAENLSLFIDLGTNGEIVLGSSDFLMTCACSAGPAFEGGDIACGMRATDGAIEKCVIDAETMKPTLKIIGAEGQKPLGICGSGLIDIVAGLFRTGIINAKGMFVREGERIITDEWGISSYTVANADETEDGKRIFIDAADIDNFIRAKGSVFSAIRTMLEAIGSVPQDIESVMIAGGIGSGIDFDSAVAIGMLPDIPREKFSYIGNTSLAGAYAMLVSGDADEAVNQTAAAMTYIELSAYPSYMDEFIAACFIPHTNASLFITSAAQ
jgi:uncharacterized 2Fe-2S/4Fe-4S cluster protein (DUF4445 family)